MMPPVWPVEPEPPPFIPPALVDPAPSERTSSGLPEHAMTRALANNPPANRTKVFANNSASNYEFSGNSPRPPPPSLGMDRRLGN
jgi:hypothetical protein